jgi:acetyl-CoA synthetase
MAGEKGMVSMMEENRVFPPPSNISKNAYIKNMEEYKRIYSNSISNPEKFWAELADQLYWYRKWDKVLVDDFVNAKHQWFVNGKINVCYNCLDRHLHTTNRNKIALIWEGEPAGQNKTYTYQELHSEVCKVANVLLKMGVTKGDRVSIYLPMIPELAIALLACARIGAVHSVVFGGFSAEALRDRILDCGSKVLICSDGYYRNGKVIPSKANADIAMEHCPIVERAIVVRRSGNEVIMKKGRDVWWHEEIAAPGVQSECEPEIMDAEDPLFILYTSGSTGKPKGVLHTQAGYLLYTLQTFKWVFDYKDKDIYWCTADIGWVTGHSYIVYGPLAAGATTVIYEGVPTFPYPDRFWQIIQKYKISIFYTAPTALRSLMREGDKWPHNCDLSSLRILGTVGEPINPEVWMWYHTTIGKGKCPVLDTWWQTETGGFVIAPFPGAVPLKPGSATVPFPGIELQILREDGSQADTNEGGWLVINKPWPGLMRGVYGDPDRFKNTYFVQFPGVYTTGDGARKDEDGYYWLMGRIDDVINVAGHRIGTAEVESALVSHEKVAEAAVVGMPHAIKGQGIYAYVTLKAGVENTDELKKELIAHVRKQIGPIATPDKIQFADGLPKTRSGKIMRRVLVKIASGEIDRVGDTSTLADPSVIGELIEGRI